MNTKHIKIVIDDNTDDDGNDYPQSGPYSINLNELLEYIKKAKLPDNTPIHIYACRYDRSNDTYLLVKAEVPKTPKDLQLEQTRLIAKEQKSIAIKRKREENKALKQAALAKLTPDERRLLK